MVRDELVRRKLAHLATYLDELSRHAAVTLEDYAARDGPRRAVERLVQLVVESAVDVNVHIVTEIEGSRLPTTGHPSPRRRSVVRSHPSWRGGSLHRPDCATS